MEKEVINSCLMLTANLDTPVDLVSVFDSADLKDTGVELDSHITITYAQGKEIAKDELLDDIKTLLGIDWIEMEKQQKSDEFVDVLDIFDIDSFENDSDYLILKLKNSCDIFKYLSIINKGIGIKYEVNSDFKTYTPHMTLAELKPGMSEKYKKSDILNAVLKDSRVKFEDFMISYGTDNDVVDRKQMFLTQTHCVDRYFRLERLKKLSKELSE